MDTHEQVKALQASVAEQVLGQADTIHQVILALLANGHVLLESLPGLAKTRTVKALASHLDAQMRRIQFTPTCCPRTSPVARSCSRPSKATASASSPGRCSAT